MKKGKSKYILNGWGKVGKRPIDEGPIIFISIYAREIDTLFTIQAFGYWIEIYTQSYSR
jgi:hypothetical protein